MFRRNRLSNQTATRTDRLHRQRRPAGSLEPLERRELLSAAIVNAIPSVVAPTSGGQAFFAPGVTRQTVSPSGTGTYSRFY